MLKYATAYLKFLLVIGSLAVYSSVRVDFQRSAIDLSAFCARLKLNYLNMPILIIKQEPSTSSKYQINVVGTLPQDVIELGFVKVDDKIHHGHGVLGVNRKQFINANVQRPADHSHDDGVG